MLTRLDSWLRDSQGMKRLSAIRTLVWYSTVFLGGTGALYAWKHKSVDHWIDVHTLRAYRIAATLFAVTFVSLIVALVRLRHHRARANTAEAALKTATKPRSRVNISTPAGHFMKPTAADRELWEWYRENLNPDGKLLQIMENHSFASWTWEPFRVLSDFLAQTTPKWTFREQWLEEYRQTLMDQGSIVIDILLAYGDPVSRPDEDTFYRFKQARYFNSPEEHQAKRQELDRALAAFVKADHDLFLKARELGFPL
jgi:hypothetical protein